MRQKNKIEKYLNKLCKKYNGQVVESTNSRYYTFNTRTLRVSDHIAKNSDGCISIILDGFDPEHYLICGHSSGKIFIFNYEDLKKFVKNFIITCHLFKSIVNTSIVIPSDSNNKREIAVEIIKKNFSKAQITTMKNWLGKHNKLRAEL